MDTLSFVLKVLALLFMCHILARMLVYFTYQVTYYHHSRHIERFLKRKNMSAEQYLEENRGIWHHGFSDAPYLRGGGTRAFIWVLLCKAREDVARRNFEAMEGLRLYCFSCHFERKCPIKYHLRCRYCMNHGCEKKRNGHDRICNRFICRSRIEKD